MSGRSRTKNGPTEQVLQLLFIQTRRQKSTTISYHGYPASVYRKPLSCKHVSIRACTCPGEDHPGPSTDVGRGAPEIDIFEAEINKLTLVSQVISQSVQFALYTHDYQYGNAATDQYKVFNPDITHANPYT